jgi:AP-2 complex subunit mu-1
MLATKEANESPIIFQDGVSFIHTNENDVTIAAATKSNPNCILLMQFLKQFIIITKSYFKGVFDEVEIRKNFVLIYELLDEVMDFGLPQITDPKLLSIYITQGKYDESKQNAEALRNFTIQATGAITWRPPNVYYKTNEVFIDIVEKVNALFSLQGNMLKSEVIGQVMMKSNLSGMPECKLGINDKLSITLQEGYQNY